MYAPKVSICIATFNECEDLEATIALVYASKYKPHQVIVCDDNSEHDPVDRLASWINRPGFAYVRNQQRQGSGPTKMRATQMATGDLLIVLDSHMRPHYEWLNQIVQAHVTHPNALLCPESIGFKQPHEQQFYGRGAWFGDNELKHGAHVLTWQPSSRLEAGPYPRIQAMHGGCYVFPSYQLRMIGGYAPTLKGWGYEEEWIAMRAAMLGIETRLINGCPIPHQYERSLHRRPAHPESRPQGWEPYYNRHAVAYGAHGQATWDSVYRARINEGTPECLRQHVDEVLQESEHELAAMHRWLSERAMPGAQWMPRLGIRHGATEAPTGSGGTQPHTIPPEAVQMALNRPSGPTKGLSNGPRE